MIAADQPVQRSPQSKLLVVDACGQMSYGLGTNAEE